MLTSVSFSIAQPWWPLCKISVTIHTLQGFYVQKKLLTVIVHYRLGCSEYLSLWSRHWKVSFLFYEGWRGEGMYRDHTGDLCFPQRWRFIASERCCFILTICTCFPSACAAGGCGGHQRKGWERLLSDSWNYRRGRQKRQDWWLSWVEAYSKGCGCCGCTQEGGSTRPHRVRVESVIGT